MNGICRLFFPLSNPLSAREFGLLGWVSSAVRCLHSHMPIRHLWLLITSQAPRLQCSESHTWLRSDYFPLQPVSSDYSSDSATLWRLTQHVTTKWLQNIGLNRKQAFKTSIASRHVFFSPKSTDIVCHWYKTVPYHFKLIWGRDLQNEQCIEVRLISFTIKNTFCVCVLV